jgi:hypothetical protein
MYVKNNCFVHSVPIINVIKHKSFFKFNKQYDTATIMLTKQYTTMNHRMHYISIQLQFSLQNIRLTERKLKIKIICARQETGRGKIAIGPN